MKQEPRATEDDLDFARFDFGNRWPPKAELLSDAYQLGTALLRAMVPPLAHEDVIPIVGLELAAFRLVPVLPPKNQINSFAKVHCETVGIKLAAEVFAPLARATRFLPYLIVPDDGDLLDWVRVRYDEWIVQVLTPALAGPFCDLPDSSERARALKLWHDRNFQTALRPDFEQTLIRLESAYFNSYGTPFDDENGPEQFQGTSPTQEKRVRGVQGCLELLYHLDTPGNDLFVLENGRLTVSQRVATQAFRKGIGSDRRMTTKVVISNEESAVARARETSPEIIEAIRSLRDLRDALDFRRAHPPLQALSEEIEGMAERGEPEAASGAKYLMLLARAVDQTKDPALKASLVYEGVGGKRASRPGAGRRESACSRESIGRHYGVTPRMIERRGSQARHEVARLIRMAS